MPVLKIENSIKDEIVEQLKENQSQISLSLINSLEYEEIFCANDGAIYILTSISGFFEDDSIQDKEQSDAERKRIALTRLRTKAYVEDITVIMIPKDLLRPNNEKKPG